MTAGSPRRRTSPAERRERHAAVEDPAVVLDAGARFLEVRPRSVAEVRRRLADAGYRPDLVAGAIERLAALGFLDDEAFARAWVESRDRAHPRGAMALRRELRRKGIDDATITAVLAERSATSPGIVVGEGDDARGPADADEAAARRLLERRAAGLLRIADPKARRQRAYALLARNGFDPDVCARVATDATSGA